MDKVGKPFHASLRFPPRARTWIHRRFRDGAKRVG